MKDWKRFSTSALVAAVMVGVGTSASALDFNLSSTGNANADAGFQLAADYLESQFNDTGVIVNITAGFSALPAGVLGQAGSTASNYTFSSWKTAIASDITSADDTTFSSNLPGGSSYSNWINRVTNNGGSSAGLLNSGITSVRVSNANAKAIGLIPVAQAGEDAQITFSSSFSFDFDPSDGISAGQIDFVGVAIHELMHAMGFTSGVDILDINAPGFSAAAYNGFQAPLDFTRHSADSLAGGADMDWTADTRAKDYSLDGGTTTLIGNAWSTGVNFGDGRQASHWKDGLGIGIMDPTSAPAGSANIVTSNDLQALDVIGWDVVPEPSSLALLGLGVLGLARRRRA